MFTKIQRRLADGLLTHNIQYDGSTPNGTSPNLAGIGVGYRENNVDFRHLSRRISETVQDRVQVTIDH